jgi:hypothetical protein
MYRRSEEHLNEQKCGEKRKQNKMERDVFPEKDLHNPALPVAAQQAQHLPLAHGVFACELQDSATHVVAVEGVGVGGVGAGELEADAVGEFLLVEVRGVRSLEVGEVEFLAGAGLRLAWLLRGRRGEMQVAGFV